MKPTEIIPQLQQILDSQLWIAGNVPHDAHFLKADAQKKVNALTESIRIVKSFENRFDVC